MAPLGLTVKPTNALRVFYFTVGAAVGGGAYVLARREVWGGAATVARATGTLAPAGAGGSGQRDPLFGPRFRGWAAAKWNGAVDATLGELARELARRGW